MIEIIQDPDNLYTADSDVIVNSSQSYVKSRIIIDQVKDRIKEGAIILITRPSYFEYYSDLDNIPGWSKVTKYSIMDILSNYELSFNDDEIREIRQLIDRNNLTGFFKAYDKSISLNDNLFNFIFGDGLAIKKLTSYKELILWIKQSLEKGRTEWRDHRYRDLIKSNVSEDLRGEFLDRLLSIETIDQLQAIKKSLISTYLFENYSISSQNIIKSKVEIFKTAYIYGDYIKKLINTYPEIVEGLNFIISTEKNKLSIFEPKDIYEFLKMTKGYLEEEWNWVWDYLKSNYDHKSLDYIKILQEAYIWSNYDNGRYRTKILLDYFKYKEEAEKYKIPQSIEEWYKYYSDFYLQWFSQMDSSKNIIGLLSKINDGFLDVTIDEIKTYKKKMEVLYQDYIYKNYPALLKQGQGNIKVINSISEYDDGNKILFFIIDGLRFELWAIIRNLFEENQYFIENDWQYCLSMIPSITSISRTSLVTGRTFGDLAYGKKHSEFSFSLLNEEKHIKRIYPNKLVEFQKGKIDDLQQLLTKNADMYVFIYTEGDKLFHATEDLPITSMEPILENLIGQVVDSVNKYHDMLIIFGTDHGSTKNHGGERAYIDLPEGIEEDQHGNCIKLFSDYFSENVLNLLKEKVNRNKFYTIWRESLRNYGLPQTIVNEEVYGWIFPKHNYYYGTKPKGFTHGGLSMDETIVPYGVFRKQQSDFKELMIEIVSIGLKLEELSHIELVLYNPNNFTIKKVIADITNLNAKNILSDIPPKGKRKIDLQFRIDKGKYRDNYFEEKLRFNIYYLNNETNQYLKLNQLIETKISDAISMEISTKRTLDF